MTKQEFYEVCAGLYEALIVQCDKSRSNAHVKLTLPDGGHLYFEVKRGGRSHE